MRCSLFQARPVCADSLASWPFLRCHLRPPCGRLLRRGGKSRWRFPYVEYDLVPRVLGRCAFYFVELVASTRESWIVVPPPPVRTAPPGAHDHPPLRFVGRPEELAPNPSWSLFRGR